MKTLNNILNTDTVTKVGYLIAATLITLAITAAIFAVNNPERISLSF